MISIPNDKKIVASIEARMSSSRLPGKVLMPVHGTPNLTRMVERLKQSSCIDDVVVATSTEQSDDAIEQWAKETGVFIYRGSLDDVLDRVVKAHEVMKSDIIVEVTGDMSLVDVELIDMGIESYFQNECDVVTNVSPELQTFPSGADVQVFSFNLLKDVAERINDPAVREHVSLYFYENPDKYRIINLIAPKRWRHPELRFDLDYREDLEFLNHIYGALEPKYGPFFGIEEVINYLNENQEVIEINKYCQKKELRVS